MFLLFSILFHDFSRVFALKPEFTLHPKTEYIVKNQLATLKCRARNAKNLEFQCNEKWFDSYKPEYAAGKDANGEPFLTASIEIKKSDVVSIFGEEKFNCHCVAWNNENGEEIIAQSASANVELAFLHKEFQAKPFPTKPYFSVGENIQLHCVPPKGLPAPRITWIKNGKILDPNRDKNLIINYDNDLIVKAARYSDSGNYVCLAENIVGSRESPAAKIEVKTDGIWSRWSDWSKCPLNSCAKIRAFRTRACDSPAPHNGGKDCDGEKREERDCANECPIDGGWSNWSKWSECSAKCVQKHERSCIRPKPENGGDECSGIGIEEIPCQGGNCKETLFSSLVDQPALAVGLAVVTVMFLTAIGIGICVIQRMRANNTKRSMRMERCQTSRCSDLYDRYIPGYMAPSTSSSSESRDNRQPQIMSTQLSNNVGDNQIEKFITAAHGGDMNFAGVNLSIPPDAVNKDQMISLRVCGSDGPLLPQHQVLLSPVVIVGPPGLKIKKTLKLSIPHCVHPGNEIYSSETRRISAGDYYGWNLEVKPIGAALKVERIKSAYQSVATLALKETGSWSIVGTPKISPNSRSFASHKAVYVLVYGRDVDLSGNEVQIRIRVSDQLPATYDMIDRDERENRSKPLCPAEVFCVAKMNSALLKDAQLQIEVLRNDSVSRAQLKQLQTQLEEASMNQNKVSKSKKSIEFENEDLVSQIEELSRSKQDIERQLADSHRERNDLCNRIEEQEEDLEETMQKYKSAIDNYNKSQSELVGVNTEFEALKSEKYLLEERLRNLKLSNEQYESNYVDKSHVLRAEARAREAETKLEFEKSTTKRLETQITRLKDNKEKYENQRSQDLSEKDREKDLSRKSKKALQEAREDLTIAERKYHESKSKVEELELEITRLGSTNDALQQDLKLAFKRISDLQQAFEALEDSDVDLSDVSSDDDPDNMTLYSSALPPVSRLGGSISRLDRDDQRTARQDEF